MIVIQKIISFINFKIIHIYFQFFWIIFSANLFAQKSDDYLPYLYLDGRALGHNITEWVLENTEKEARRKDYLIKTFVLETIDARFVLGVRNEPEQRKKIDQLYEWIMLQKDNSITPDILYKKAIEIEKGQISRAMALVWNVLLIDGHKSFSRNSFPHVKKLVDITGEFAIFQGYNVKDPKVKNGKIVAKSPDKPKLITNRLPLKRGDKFGS